MFDKPGIGNGSNAALPQSASGPGPLSQGQAQAGNNTVFQSAQQHQNQMASAQSVPPFQVSSRLHSHYCRSRPSRFELRRSAKSYSLSGFQFNCRKHNFRDRRRPRQCHWSKYGRANSRSEQFRCS